MAFQDLMLSALTYPDATSDLALRSGVALAKRIGGNLNLSAVQVVMPAMHNPIANALIKLDALADQASAQSVQRVTDVTSCVSQAAEVDSVSLDVTVLHAQLLETDNVLCEAAHSRDLTLVSIDPSSISDPALAEALLFGSGRPILIYSSRVEIAATTGFDNVAIAWDNGPKAARAVADALPLLAKAKIVRILVATDEKASVKKGGASDIVRHLKSHAIDCLVDERPAAGRPIGTLLAEYVLAQGIDLLVMGGYGHARIREFILGGATQSVLQAPPCPVLMSH